MKSPRSSLASKLQLVQPQLPKGGGALRSISDSFQPQAFSGTASLTIPLPVSSCRGFEPKLQLEYDSGSGNGPFGVGFRLSLSQISRSLTRRIPSYTDDDTFTLSGAGELVRKLKPSRDGWEVVSRTISTPDVAWKVTEYRPRVEQEFARIEQWMRLADGDIFWQATDRDNVVHIFGKDQHARLADPHDGKRTLAWLLESSTDAKGNRIVYTYKAENGEKVPDTVSEVGRDKRAQRYLHKVRYGPDEDPETGEQSWHFEIVFDYGERNFADLRTLDYESFDPWPVRQDPFSTYRPGFEIRTFRLCHAVLLYHRFPRLNDGAPQLISALRFRYQQTPRMSFLQAIEEIGFRLNDQGKLEFLRTPPLELSYSRSDPTFLFSLGGEFASCLQPGPVPEALRTEFRLNDVALSSSAQMTGEASGKWSIIDGERAYLIERNYELEERVEWPDGKAPLAYAAGTSTRLDVFQPARAPKFEPLVIDGGALPGLIDQGGYTMVDLDSEGLPGMLYTDESTILYWKPRGEGILDSPQAPSHFPLARIEEARESFLSDVAANGLLDLEVRAEAASGVYPRRPDGSWGEFLPFESFPTDANQPIFVTVDTSGDGRHDLLVIEEQTVKVYRSKGYRGYAAAEFRAKPPGLPLNTAPSQREVVRFADVFGDGGSHLIRIRNGAVECWPNLGHGKFGERVALASAPHFAEELDPARLFLADIDGSGTTDLIYVEHERLLIYFNESGNSFSAVPYIVPLPSSWDSISDLQFADVLGNGTACAVLTTVDEDLKANHRYYDFTGGIKPHLLVEVDNSMGALTRVSYAPSTRFYLEDRKAGRPWVTRLPFPVQVVESVLTIDQIVDSRQTRRFRYHDGYYDPVEREFRGFGMVETWDTERFDLFEQTVGAGDDSELAIAAQDGLIVAPAYTKSWYHTGAFFESGMINKENTSAYFHQDPDALLLQNTVFGEGLDEADAETLREAYAALQGAVIRQEVYGLDAEQNTGFQTPYTVTQTNSHVRLLQPRAQQKHAAFYVHERESLAYDYERNASDPRATHSFIEVDLWGNVLRTCQVFYPRRNYLQPLSPNPAERRQPEQALLRVVADVDSYINKLDSFYLLGVPQEQRSFELLGLTPGQNGYFTFEQMAEQMHQALGHVISFDEEIGIAGPCARLLSWNRQYYINTDALTIPLIEPLPFGESSAQALLYSSLTAIFTTNLIEKVYGSRLSEEQVTAAGFHLDADGDYWWNAGLMCGYASAEDFYLPVMTVDPFGATTTVSYDAYHLVVTRLTDAMGNETVAEIDYQTPNLSAHRILDPNNNLSEVLFDPLGTVIATSVQGRVGKRGVGDAPLTEYDTVVSNRQVFHTPLEEVVRHPRQYLQKATSFFAYDLFAWRRGRQPPAFFSVDRMLHVSEEKGEPVEILQTIGYFDGFGRALQTKQKAAPGLAWTINDEGLTEIFTDDRWLTTGRTVYNNKGAPVKQYEPYFTNAPGYAPEAIISEFGVTPVYHYDALLRLVRTDLPAGYFTKTERTAWVETYYDADDTILESSYFANRQDLTADELEALAKTLVFADTPQQTVLDNMGRSFLAVEMHTRSKVRTPEDEAGRTPIRYLSTHHALDIQGNVIVSSDPRIHRLNETSATPSANFQNIYDMTGNILYTDSADAGKRWAFRNALGSTLFNWDSRGFCIETQYDALQRKKQVFVEGDDGRGLSLNQVVEFINYGDEPGYSKAQQNNQRGRPVEYYDQAGRLQYLLYGISGESLESVRQFRAGYSDEADWTVVNGQVNADHQLEPETYTQTWEYDALGRLRSETAPDGTTVDDGSRFIYEYHPQGWLRKVQVTQSSGVPRSFISETVYNARGQRTEIIYGNHVTGEYEYDPKTFLLTRLRTWRKSVPDDAPDGLKYLLQDLNYTYDPVGNITLVSFADQKPVVYDNQLVEPRASYTYDSLYRLIEAQGREHPGLSNSSGHPAERYLPTPKIQLNDANKLTPYTRLYHYDGAGNLRWMRHVAKDAQRCFTRQLQMEGPGTKPPAPASNRLSRVCTTPIPSTLSEGGSTPGKRFCESVQYDANGNMETLEGNRQVYWNYRNNISHVPTIERRDSNPNDGDYYIYNFSGQRVRRVTQRLRDGKSGLIEIEEKVYFGTLEILRRWLVSPGSGERRKLNLERKSLQVRGGDDRVAIVHHWTVKPALTDNGKLPDEQVRYQLQDDLGSVMLELDAVAGVLTYEEYFPYGGTSLMWGRNRLDSALKEYRYSGKERDDATGLYYYGARYYAPWLCRWLSTDPAWTIDGLNLYAFVGGNPITHEDVDGTGRVNSKTKASRKSVKVPQKPSRISPRLKEKRAEAAKLFEAPEGTIGDYYKGNEVEKNPAKYSNIKAVRAKIKKRLRKQITAGKPLAGVPPEIAAKVEQMHMQGTDVFEMIMEDVTSPLNPNNEIKRPLIVFATIRPSSGQKKIGASTPHGGIDTARDDRGHLAPEAGVSPNFSDKVNSPNNVIAENWVINQHYKTPFEEVAKKMAAQYSVMTVHQPNYQSKKGPLASFRARPKSVTHYMAINGVIVAAITLKNSKETLRFRRA